MRSRPGDYEAMGVTMGMTAPVLLASWVVMMVAMSVPTASPLVLASARVM